MSFSLYPESTSPASLTTDEKMSNPMPSLFAASMLMWTRKGETFSESDYNQWFVESALKPAGMHASAGMPASFLFADKP
jgi:hypothetical protein